MKRWPEIGYFMIARSIFSPFHRATHRPSGTWERHHPMAWDGKKREARSCPPQRVERQHGRPVPARVTRARRDAWKDSTARWWVCAGEGRRRWRPRGVAHACCVPVGRVTCARPLQTCGTQNPRRPAAGAREVRAAQPAQCVAAHAARSPGMAAGVGTCGRTAGSLRERRACPLFAVARRAP